MLFVGGAGGSLRAGVVENPVNLTRSVQGLQTYVTVGGAPVYVWPGGGITLMVDVMRVPENAFGSVPTPALVAPIEFTCAATTMSRSAATRRRSAASTTCIATGGEFLNPRDGAAVARRQSLAAAGAAAPQAAGLTRHDARARRSRWLPDGRRLHLNHGPIDLIVEAFGATDEVAGGLCAGRRALRDGLLDELVGRTAGAARARPRPASPRFRRPRRRGAWRRRCCPLRGNTSSRRWPPSPARWPTRCWPR